MALSVIILALPHWLSGVCCAPPSKGCYLYLPLCLQTAPAAGSRAEGAYTQTLPGSSTSPSTDLTWTRYSPSSLPWPCLPGP